MRTCAQVPQPEADSVAPDRSSIYHGNRCEKFTMATGAKSAALRFPAVTGV